MRYPVADGHRGKQIHNNDRNINYVKMQETPLVGDASLLCRAAGLPVDFSRPPESSAAQSLSAIQRYPINLRISVSCLINRFSTKFAELGIASSILHENA
jgi:hypothetical protein